MDPTITHHPPSARALGPAQSLTCVTNCWHPSRCATYQQASAIVAALERRKLADIAPEQYSHRTQEHEGERHRVTKQVERVYLALDEAIRRNVLIEREGTRDKEFHFQEWFQARLDDAGIKYTTAGRNSYPDYSLTDSSEGFEIKGLAHPGRVADFDANSQMPTGLHNGRTIYYVFGRYPKVPEGNEYPVIDLVLCHGDLLNADKHYVHKNRSIRGFGSYGDILIRDRKMYVVPTPFALLEYTAFRRTLILGELHRRMQGTGHDGRCYPQHPSRWRSPEYGTAPHFRRTRPHRGHARSRPRHLRDRTTPRPGPLDGVARTRPQRHAGGI